MDFPGGPVANTPVPNARGPAKFQDNANFIQQEINTPWNDAGGSETTYK